MYYFIFTLYIDILTIVSELYGVEIVRLNCNLLEFILNCICNDMARTLRVGGTIITHKRDMYGVCNVYLFYKTFTARHGHLF